MTTSPQPVPSPSPPKRRRHLLLAVLVPLGLLLVVLAWNLLRSPLPEVQVPTDPQALQQLLDGQAPALAGEGAGAADQVTRASLEDEAPAGGARSAVEVTPRVEDLAAVYGERQGRALWVGRRGPSEEAARLLELFDEAPELGIAAAPVPSRGVRAAVASLEQALDGDAPVAPEGGGDGEVEEDEASPDGTDGEAAQGLALEDLTPTRLARLDAALSWTFLELAERAVRGSVDPREAAAGEWALEAPEVDRELLRRALRQAGEDGPEAALAPLAPSHPEARALRQARDRYRQLVEAGGWPTVETEGRAFEVGDPLGPELRAALVARLRAEGDLAESDLAEGELGAGEVYDQALADGVARFQERHGLEADGVLGAGTVAAMAVSAEERLATIELNLERWRWMPRELIEDPQRRHVRVNLPTYTLQAFDGGRPALEMPVVIGQQGWQTPPLASAIDRVQVNPYWNVPASIAEAEVLPEAQASDGGSIEAKRFEVLVDGEPVDPDAMDWDEVSVSQVRFRQQPGAGNALGRVKILFPNDHNVYLHDTPAQSGFERPQRALSHGCVRVSEPLTLAAWVLDDGQWDEAALERAVASGDRPHLTLEDDERVPVYFVYLTATADEEGRVTFLDDVYGHDRTLERALAAAAERLDSPLDGPLEAGEDGLTRVAEIR